MSKLIGRFLAAMVLGWAGSAAAAPITDIVTVNGREWAQVDLFEGLGWNDINAVCPGGVCGNGTLNGFDVAGWSWATSSDLNTLFNHYIGFAALGPGPDEHRDDPDTFADLFFADGWRLTGILLLDSKITAGYSADSASYWSMMFAIRDTALICSALYCSPDARDYDAAYTNFDLQVTLPNNLLGAWFARTPAEVPGPTTLSLFGLALALLRYRRKIRAE